MEFPNSQAEWEELLQGKFDRKAITGFLKGDATSRKYFLDIILLPKAYAWRAAWLLRDALHQDDDYTSFIARSLSILPQLNDGHQREILKIIEKLELDEQSEGPLFDVCMGIWESPGKSPSVRMSAFLFILETVKKYPELKTELEHLTQAHYMETLSPGVKRVLEKRIRLLK